MRSTRLLAYALLAVIFAGTASIGVRLWEQGFRVYIIHTGSMAPTFEPGGIVIDRPADAPLHVGEAVTFLHSDLTSDLVTHRIKSLHGGVIRTKGDADRTADPWRIRRDQVQGVVATYVPDLGYLLVFLKQPAGVGAVMTGFIAIVLLWGLFFSRGTAEATSTVNRRGPRAVEGLRSKRVASSS